LGLLVGDVAFEEAACRGIENEPLARHAALEAATSNVERLEDEAVLEVGLFSTGLLSSARRVHSRNLSPSWL
jgi:hypothetical protein